MRWLMSLALAAAFAVGGLALTNTDVAATSGSGVLLSSGCGIKPIKPIPPIGCKDLRAVCTCDSEGKDCWWEWVCTG